MMTPNDPSDGPKSFDVLAKSEPTKQDQQIQELQDQIEFLRDARREDQFVCVFVAVLLFDVVFFSVMPSFGGPLALLVLELLILIPLAKRMGMEEIAQILSSVLHRVAGKSKGDE